MADRCNYLCASSGAALLTPRNAIPDIETFIMRQRKNNDRLSRSRVAQPAQKDKGIRFFGGNGNGISISSRVSSRDAISHLPSTCSPSSLSFSVSPSFAGSRLSSKFSGSHVETSPWGSLARRTSDLSSLGEYFYVALFMQMNDVVPQKEREEGERVIRGNNTSRVAMSTTLPIEKSHKSLIAASAISVALLDLSPCKPSLRERYN